MNNMPEQRSDDGVWNLDEVEEKVADSTQWGLVGAKTYKGFPRTQKRLPAGVYSITLDRNDGKAIFVRREVATDDIIELEKGLTKTMLDEIKLFWRKEEQFKQLGFLHRRGYLLYGPQGTGKSSVVKQIMSDVVQKGGLVFLCDNPKFFNDALVTLRQAEPSRQVVCVFEDIDAIIARYGEDELLSVLDGANAIDHVLNVATTNYPERLDRRLVARPRRFDRVIKVGLPGENNRRQFLTARLPGKKGKARDKEIEKLVSKTSDLSMAAMTELLISVYCLGNDVDDSVAILKALNTKNPSSSDFEKGGSIGFMSDFKGGKGGDSDIDDEDD